jgi:hypothetical protein
MTDKYEVDYLRNQVIWFLLEEYHKDIIENAEAFVKKYLKEEKEKG